jgi:hypothetical protein
MQQLRCADLRSGDILLKMANETMTHAIIQFGQRVLAGQKNWRLAHAAIAFDTQFAIEAQAVGVTANHLSMKNRDCGYIVFRPNVVSLGQGAATAAKLLFDIAKTHDNMKYNTPGVVTGIFGSKGTSKSAGEMDALLTKVLQGKGHKFFCSQFVVYVYQWAAEQCGIPARNVFDIADPKVSPSDLATLLTANTHFSEVGYMVAFER